ncbi:MAG: hypothetical protein U0230_14045 [Polyangiales bacterium]
MKPTTIRWLAVIACVGTLAPGAVSAQTPWFGGTPPPATAAPTAPPPDWDGLRAILYFDVGGGGTQKFEFDPSSGGSNGSVDNDPTVGLGLRIEHTLSDYLALGAQAELLSYKLEGADRNIGGHFDGWIKSRYLHRINANVAQETYLGMPVGFSIIRFDSNPTLTRETSSLGWNIGLLAGTQFLVRGRLGTMLEMGWRRIELHNEVAASGANLTTKQNQFVLNIGYLMHF